MGIKNRRSERIIVRCSQAEKKLIYDRCKKLGFRDLSSYIRKVSIDVTVINIDTTGLHELAVQISRIGNNINQITRQYRKEHNLGKETVSFLLEHMKSLTEIGNKFYDDMFRLRSKTEIEE